MSVEKRAFGIVILGASKFPHYRHLDNPAFRTSAEAFKSLMMRPDLFLDGPASVLDLFDVDCSAEEIISKTRSFLSSERFSDIILYYCGHGDFLADRKYALWLRNSELDNEYYTCLPWAWTYRRLAPAIAFKRSYIILDCCFAAGAVSAFQANSVGTLIEEQTFSGLPRRGVALVAASSKDDVALAPANKPMTMFSGALIETLTVGITNAGASLSFRDVITCVRRTLNANKEIVASLPEIHDPVQPDGDISGLSSFINFSHRAPTLDDAPSLSQTPRFDRDDFDLGSTAKTSDDIFLIDAYLTAFPKGIFSALARKRLQQLLNASQDIDTLEAFVDACSDDSNRTHARLRAATLSWSALHITQDRQALQSFVQRYEGCPEAVLANTTLYSLDRGAAWQSAVDSKGVSELESFVERYTEGSLDDAGKNLIASARKILADRTTELEWAHLVSNGPAISISRFIKRPENARFIPEGLQEISRLAAREWQQISGSNDKTAFQTYIDLFSGSPESRLARRKLKEIEREDDWTLAEQNKSLDSIRVFFERYGSSTSDARISQLLAAAPHKVAEKILASWRHSAFSTNKIDPVKRLIFQLDVIAAFKHSGLSNSVFLVQTKTDSIDRVAYLYRHEWSMIRDGDYRSVAQFLESDPPADLAEEAEAKLAYRLSRDLEIIHDPALQARAIAEFHAFVDDSKLKRRSADMSGSETKLFRRDREKAWVALRDQPDDVKVSEFFQRFFDRSSDDTGKNMMREATLYLWTDLMKRHCPPAPMQ